MRNRVSCRVSCLVLSLLSLLIVATRMRTYGEPVNRDSATYSIMAREVLDGRRLYVDTWDSKPPLIFATYAAAQSVAGFGYSSILLLSAAGSILAMLGIFYAASARARGRLAGLIAAGVFTLAASDYRLQGNEANTELFMNACLAWAFGVLLRLHPAHVRFGLACVVGGLVSIASLFKTVAVVHAAAFAAAYLLGHRKGPGLRVALTQVAAMALGSAIPWLVAFGWTWARGSLDAMLEAVFEYNRFYSGIGGLGIGGNLVRSFLPKNLASPAMLAALPLVVFIVLGVLAGRRRRVSRSGCLVIAYDVASHVAVAMPGQFAAHYYQLWSPPLCIGAGWAAMALSRRLGRAARNPRLARGPVVALLLCTAAIALPPYAFNAAEWSRMKYGADPAVEVQTGHAIRKLLKPGETFYQWGTTIGLHFAAQTPLPSGVFFVQPLLGGPQQEECAQRLIRDLEQTRPELVVMDARDMPPMTRHPVVQWFARNYDEMGKDPVTGRFRLLCLKGGRLSREWRQ